MIITRQSPSSHCTSAPKASATNLAGTKVLPFIITACPILFGRSWFVGIVITCVVIVSFVSSISLVIITVHVSSSKATFAPKVSAIMRIGTIALWCSGSIKVAPILLSVYMPFMLYTFTPISSCSMVGIYCGSFIVIVAMFDVVCAVLLPVYLVCIVVVCYYYTVTVYAGCGWCGCVYC